MSAWAPVLEHTRLFQSIEGMTLGDIEDDFQTMTYTFTGLPEVLLQFAQQISGATGIPLVRLFGQSPVGFNSTGESDIRLYYDNTKQQQEKMLRPGLKKILNIIYMSVTGHTPDKDFNFDFRPLWQMTNEQKGAYATAMVGAIVQALQSESISLPSAIRSSKSSARPSAFSPRSPRRTSTRPRSKKTSSCRQGQED